MLLALLIAGAVTVEGDTTCPSATRVSEVLATLLTTVDSREAHHARLREHPDGIEVELRSGLGRLLAQRTLSRDASCEELASAIAVVIATWETGFAGDTPDIRVSARPALVVVETPPSTTITLAGGALVAFDRLGGSAGGLAGIVIGSARTRWSGRFAALAMTRKREPLAAGSVLWAREALAVGARYRVATTGPLVFALSGDLALGLLVASGEGFTENRTALSFDPGSCLGAHVQLIHGVIAVFLDASETLWWRKGHLEVTGVSEVVDLPRFEFHLTAGIEWQINR